MRTSQMTRFFIGLSMLFIVTKSICQKEDFTWIVNFDIVCDLHPYPETCGASVISFKDNVVEFYKEPLGVLDLLCTNAVVCDKDGDLLLYSNGMSIHGKDHLSLIHI